MLLFEFDQGQLLPTQLGWRSPEDIDPEVMGAVRDQVIQLIGRTLFPIQWTGAEGSHAARAEPHRLVAMDASGQVVSVEVLAALDSVGLVDALARAGRTAALGWLDLAELYPRGAAVFRRDWNVFRESLPPRPIPGPRLYIVTSRIADDVRPALEMLADSGVEVFEVSQRELANGRRFIEVTEPFRVSVPTINAYAALQAGRRPDLVIDHDEDIRQLLAVAPDGQNIDADIVETPGAVHPFGSPADEVDEDAADEDAGAADPHMLAIAEVCGEETPLVWVQHRKGLRHEAVLRLDGTLALPDGRLFADPSRAAAIASGRRGVDGWQLWRITEGGPTLAEARDEVMQPRPQRERRH
ncbi:MAG: hypothetical protein EOL89_02245 [Actinobacteria bacterium]|nr:hypothetical protein [Actinomycetota bacterium]